VVASGTVSSYVGTALTINPTYSYGGTYFSTGTFTGWTIIQTNLGHISKWFTDIGNYPSNADVWWYLPISVNHLLMCPRLVWIIVHPVNVTGRKCSPVAIRRFIVRAVPTGN